MRWHRVSTTALYAWFHTTHSMETWVDLVWFPLTNILMFGFFLNFFLALEPAEATAIITGLIFWEVMRVLQYSISVGMMWDVWSKSFSTLFVSPLTMPEFIAGQTIGGVMKAAFVFALLSFLAWILFGLNPFGLGMMLVPYTLMLILFGVSMGLFVLGMIVRFGTDIQSLSWSLIYLYQPISAVIYPLEALPPSVRWVAYASPMTYVMEAVRAQLSTGRLAWDLLAMSLIVNMIYLVLTTALFAWAIKWSKQTGAFARLEM